MRDPFGVTHLALTVQMAAGIARIHQVMHRCYIDPAAGLDNVVISCCGGRPRRGYSSVKVSGQRPCPPSVTLEAGGVTDLG